MQPRHPFRVLRDFDPIRVQRQLAPASDAEHAAFLHEQSMLLREARERIAAGDRRGMVLICDAAYDMPMPPAQRAMEADWLSENEAILKQMCLATFMVVPGTMLRAGVTAVMWLARPAFPIRAVATLDQAVSRAISIADEHGLSVSAELREHGAAGVEAALARQPVYEAQSA